MMRLLFTLVFISFANAELGGNIIDIPNDLEEDIRRVRSVCRYVPSWSDLDTRPLPEWYDSAKIGIILHWGVYSVPSFGSEWFWFNWKDKPGQNQEYKDFMSKNYLPSFRYQEFAPMFTAEFFDPSSWAELFVKAGAKYVILTSKHFEGYALFPSKHSFGWNSVDVGPRRDLVGELSAAVRNENLKFGVYHTLSEWYNPIYNQDKSKNFGTQIYTDTHLWPDIKQLVNDYKPSVIWANTFGEVTDKYYRAEDLLAWLYNDSPVKDEVVVSDGWGSGIYGYHGDFYQKSDPGGKYLTHKWEKSIKVDRKSWGYRRNMHLADILSIEQLLDEVVSAVSCGGNVVIGVGPTKEGTIIPIFRERLLQLGKWLSINGEAIYNSSPWHSQKDTLNDKVWYTCFKATYNATHPTHPPSVNDKVELIFSILLAWPEKSVLKLRDITPYLHSDTYQVEMLGNEGQYLTWNITKGEVAIQLPDISSVKSHRAWTLKFTLK